MTTIDGAVVLVTGANGGLGEEFVAQALDRGARRVYAAARSPREWADARVVGLRLDVSDPRSIDAAAEIAADTTILVNNAGIVRRSDLLTGPVQDVRDQLETNLFGPLLMTRGFAPALIAAGGAVINIASALSWLPTGTGYSISKAALWSATNALRLELGPQGVQVLGAYLAYTDTPMTAGRDPAGMNRPEDVVAAVLDGVEAGEDEVLADQVTRDVRSLLSRPIADLVGAR